MPRAFSSPTPPLLRPLLLALPPSTTHFSFWLSGSLRRRFAWGEPRQLAEFITWKKTQAPNQKKSPKRDEINELSFPFERGWVFMRRVRLGVWGVVLVCVCVCVGVGGVVLCRCVCVTCWSFYGHLQSLTQFAFWLSGSLRRLKRTRGLVSVFLSLRPTFWSFVRTNCA